MTGIDTGHFRLFMHGLLMYLMWCFLGIFLLASKRYFKVNWLSMHIAHMIVGTGVFVGSVYLGFKIIRFFAGNIHPDVHQIMGCLSLFFSAVSSILGLITSGLQTFYKGDKAWTDNDMARRAAFYHRWSGYFILFLANATCMTGALNFVQKQLKQQQYTSVFVITLPLFLVMVIGFEIKYRLKDEKG